ncbi:MAG: proton-conducting transporter transmembrane domain-containing protein, partial [Thermoguttaceae bacterium]
GIGGVLFALAQHDLKRLLAYSSVENIGIITMGLGVGLLGIAYRIPAMALLGVIGALLHVLNHACFKSLLFLGAGAVQHATGTRNVNRLGGLLKRMPRTGTAFLVGAWAISGLPPLNGFVSELLIYLAVLLALTDPSRSGAVPWAQLGVLVVGGLALIGGLATACFTGAFGSVFLGEPRTDEARKAHEAAPAMRGPMYALAAACLAAALGAPALLPWLVPAAMDVLPPDLGAEAAAVLSASLRPVTAICIFSWIFLATFGLIAWARHRLLSGSRVEQGPTWDCGYAAPTARMQYTASSFAGPFLVLFHLFLRPRIRLQRPTGLFPEKASFSSTTPDVFAEYVFGPGLAAIAWVASKLRRFQHGRIQLYVLYIALTILVLLIWKLG